MGGLLQSGIPRTQVDASSTPVSVFAQQLYPVDGLYCTREKLPSFSHCGILAPIRPAPPHDFALATAR